MMFNISDFPLVLFVCCYSNVISDHKPTDSPNSDDKIRRLSMPSGRTHQVGFHPPVCMFIFKTRKCRKFF